VPTIIIVIIVAVIFVGSAFGGWTRYKQRKLRASFGPEFETVAREHDTPRLVDRELRRRKSLHSELSLQPINEQDQEYYTTSWDHLQSGFLDDPAMALGSAEQLVEKLLDVRGYPGAGHEEQIALLSVEHAHALTDYRAAQYVSRRAKANPASTPTEDLRQALLSYHVLFTELLAGASVATSR